MGTRGAFGVRVAGKDYIWYNHSDSYPAGLGDNIVAELYGVIDAGGIARMAKRVQQLRNVNPNDRPTKQDVKAHPTIGDGDWYRTLQDTEGSLVRSLEWDVYIQSKHFLTESLFCEWAYIINVDSECLEVYRGFVRSRKGARGRYVGTKPRGWKPQYVSQDFFYGVSLIETIPFWKLIGFRHVTGKPLTLSTLNLNNPPEDGEGGVELPEAVTRAILGNLKRSEAYVSA